MKIMAVFGRNAYGDPRRGEGYEHANILPDLDRLPGVTHVSLFDAWDRSQYDGFAALNAAFVRRVAEQQPDVIFLVLMNYEIWTETLDLIRANSPATLVHWGTDDSWKYAEFTRFIAPHVDLHVTTDAHAFETASRNRATNVALSQWAACSAKLAEPLPSAACTFDVSFVGACYGNRPKWIAALAERGIKVACFGHGWPGGVVAAEKLPDIVRSSRLSLNFADSGLKLTARGVVRSRQIKARVFEVPGAGGVLLTEHADGIERYFDTHSEIATFHDKDELAHQIRAYLADPTARDALAAGGHKRVAVEHTYRMRLPMLIARAQETSRSARAERAWTLDVAQLQPAIKQHVSGLAVRAGGHGLRRLGRIAFGPLKGPRVARRMAHELSWRLHGAKTYSAAGLPGQLFYRES